MMFNRKIQAGALQYTILIAFIIILLTGFFILNFFLNGRFIDDQIILSNLNSKVNSALVLFMNDKENSTNSTQIDVFDDNTELVDITSKPWGGYKIINASIKKNQFEVKKSVLAGYDILSGNIPAIYLTDNRRYLTVSGSNVIKGDCYLPLQGVDRGRFSGVGFIGTTPIEGEIKVSDQRLPEPDNNLISEIDQLRNQNNRNDSIIYFEDIQNNEMITHSFSESSLNIFSDNIIYISNQTLKGNIIVKSDTLVEIEANAQLSDIIIIAPYVNIKSNFKGSVHLIAENEINIESESTLLLPSSVILKEQKSNIVEKSSFINIKGKSTICGIIMLITESRINNNSRVIIEPEAEIYGQVYSNNFVEHKGKVYGSIYCDKFFRTSGANVYYNLLYNSTTDVSLLPKEYRGISLFGDNLPMDILKEIY